MEERKTPRQSYADSDDELQQDEHDLRMFDEMRIEANRNAYMESKRQQSRKVQMMQRPTQSRTEERLQHHLEESRQAQSGFTRIQNQVHGIASTIMAKRYLRKKRHYALDADIERVRKLKATLNALNPRKEGYQAFELGRNDGRVDSVDLESTRYMYMVRVRGSRNGMCSLEEIEVPYSVLEAMVSHQKYVQNRLVGFVICENATDSRHAVAAVLDHVNRVIEFYDPNGWAAIGQSDYWKEGKEVLKIFQEEWVPYFNGTHQDREGQEYVTELMTSLEWPIGGWKVVEPQKYAQYNWREKMQQGGYCIHYSALYLRLRSEGKSMAEVATHLAQPAFACGSVAKVAMGKDPKTWGARTRRRTKSKRAHTKTAARHVRVRRHHRR